MEGGLCRQLMKSSLPYVGMTSAVAALAVNSIVSKMAMSKGMSFYVLSVYSNGLATLILFPTAFLFHGLSLPKFSFGVLWRIFLLAFFGCFADIGSYAGLKFSSPTLSTAMLNLVPAYTYVLAVIFRMEEVNWSRLSSISKSVGTVVSMSGAFVVTFYRGPAILNGEIAHPTKLILSSQQNWILGGCLFGCSSFLVASWCILQASILQMFPVEMIIVAFYSLFVTIQAAMASLFAERDVTAWRIDTGVALIAIFYSAIINISFRLYVTSWCIWKKGPFFVAMFKPLTVVIAVAISVIFLKDVFYLGSLVGAIILVVGFYAVMWGKEKEREIHKATDSSNHSVPLLQDKGDQV